ISYQLQHFLHQPVDFVILPIVALANSGITIPPNWAERVCSSKSLGIIFGLVIGKPLGIFLFAWGAVVAGLTSLPSGMRKRHLLGLGTLAGIGFTMSIFITLLAFKDPEIVINSKIAVFLASLVAGLAGFFFLKFTLPKKSKQEEEED
ncbi:MAG: Na+/H+ antiporter NhaA, partial [Saprospiraceae bacterium]|nr:Na+/H+ antiporter NhaA [Saprospiraceae bacterium]